MQPAASLDSRSIRTLPGRQHPNPLLWLCREMIWQGFHDACQVDDSGAPTTRACESVVWIEQCLDWTTTKTIPPEDMREEYILSFEFCCSYLNLDPDRVRREGLPREVASVLTRGSKRWRTRPRVARGGHNSRSHVAGLAHVYRIWAAAAERHANEQHSDARATVTHEQEQLLCVQ
jgi:hypothetical protein